jgi:hypothetical protein
MLNPTLEKKRPSETKLMTAAIFIILGRMCLFGGFAALTIFFLYSYPPYLWNIILVIAFGVVLLALASSWVLGNTIKTFGGLFHQSLAISFLLPLASILRVHLTQEAATLTLAEIIVVIVGGATLASYIMLYKKQSKKRKPRKNQAAG